jgi:hypothetical protein
MVDVLHPGAPDGVRSVALGSREPVIARVLLGRG